MAEIPKGRFVWYDLMSTDLDAAKNFYTKLIGWGTAPFEGGPMPYTMWTNGETPLGGMMPLPEQAQKAGAPPHWLSYIAVENVDKTVEQATGLGASILMAAQEIPMVGRFAGIADPQGAVIAVFTPAGDTPGHDGPPQPGEFSWHELATDDWQKARDFYQTVFGWEKKEEMDMGELGTYYMYGRPGEPIPLGGMFNRPKEMPANAWLYYAMVDDVHAKVEEVKKLGGTLLNGPMEVPGGDFVAQFMDPQGAAFALHSTKK